MAVHGPDGILRCHELNVAILSLGGDAFHDNVNGFLIVIEDLGVAAEKGNDLGALGAKRNLQVGQLRLWQHGYEGQ